jgi:hypothetical protein
MCFFRYANACYPKAAATTFVEEATYHTNFECVLAFLHLFMALHRPYFFYSTLPPKFRCCCWLLRDRLWPVVLEVRLSGSPDVTNYESDCLCLSAWWCLMSSALSQLYLFFIEHNLYRSGLTWYNKEREGQLEVDRWSITVNDRHTDVRSYRIRRKRTR